MFSTKSKIILAVVVLFFVALIVVLIFNATRKTDQTTEPQEFIQTPESSSAAGLPTYPSDQTETRTAITGFSRSQTPPIPPVPSRTITSSGLITPTTSATKTASTDTGIAGKTIGYFDWTRSPTLNQKSIIPEDIQRKVASTDICTLAGLSNTWSNPVEKTLCSIIKMFDKQLLDPLSQLTCSVTGAGLASNYGEEIKSQYIDYQCVLTDRK